MLLNYQTNNLCRSAIFVLWSYWTIFAKMQSWCFTVIEQSLQRRKLYALQLQNNLWKMQTWCFSIIDRTVFTSLHKCSHLLWICWTVLPKMQSWCFIVQSLQKRTLQKLQSFQERKPWCFPIFEQSLQNCNAIQSISLSQKKKNQKSKCAGGVTAMDDFLIKFFNLSFLSNNLFQERKPWCFPIFVQHLQNCNVIEEEINKKTNQSLSLSLFLKKNQNILVVWRPWTTSWSSSLCFFF